MSIEESKQSLNPGKRVELYDFDATDIGGPTYYWCSSFKEENPIVWQGRIYVPLPIIADGFEVNGKGALPIPKLRIANVKKQVSAIINDIGDPLGARITRWVTFDKYLDDGLEANPDEHFRKQVFFVQQKTAQNKVYVEFALSSIIDQEGKMLPKRQVIRDTCSFTYRVYNPDTNMFEYEKAICPYAGAKMFKANGDPTTDPALDQCGHRLSDCRLRFENNPLPFGGFPAVARVR